jgi:hypothetical protein
LRQWRYGVFSEEVLIFSAEGRNMQVDVKEANPSQRLGKNKWIFLRFLQKQVDVFKWQTETFFIILPDVPKLFIVVSDQVFSILPMIFQLSLLKTLLSRTEVASRILFLGKDQGAVTVTKF